MIFVTSLRKITLNKQFIIIILIYLRVVQKWTIVNNHVSVFLNGFYTKMVVIKFQIRSEWIWMFSIKSNLNWNDRGRWKYALAQCENRPNFLIELIYLNTYSFTKTCRKTIMFNWNIVSCVRHLKPFSNE